MFATNIGTEYFKHDIYSPTSEVLRLLKPGHVESFKIGAGEEWSRSVGPIM